MRIEYSNTSITFIVGKGLGKNENGIAEALKPKLKFDTSGVGHKDVDFEWWDSVYDKALKNIVLNKKSDEVSIHTAKENAFNISSTKSGLEATKKKHSLHYGKFLKTSTLQNGNMIIDSTCEVMEASTQDNPVIFKMSDDELFKACGGRTAHKGARHGLTLRGKLARIAEQEKQLLAAKFLKSNNESLECNEVKQKKKKKRKKEMEVEDCTTMVKDEHISDDDDDCIKLPSTARTEDYKPSRKTCRKNERKIQDLTQQLTTSCMIQEDSINDNKEKGSGTCKNKAHNEKNKPNKKKNKRKKDQEIVDNSNECQINDDVPMEPQTKKSRKCTKSSETTSSLQQNHELLSGTEISDHSKTAKRKKKCRKADHSSNVGKCNTGSTNENQVDDDVSMEPHVKKLRKCSIKSSETISPLEQIDEFSNCTKTDDHSKNEKRKKKCKKSKNHNSESSKYNVGTNELQMNDDTPIELHKKQSRKSNDHSLEQSIEPSDCAGIIDHLKPTKRKSKCKKVHSSKDHKYNISNVIQTNIGDDLLMDPHLKKSRKSDAKLPKSIPSSRHDDVSPNYSKVTDYLKTVKSTCKKDKIYNLSKGHKSTHCINTEVQRLNAKITLKKMKKYEKKEKKKVEKLSEGLLAVSLDARSAEENVA